MDIALVVGLGITLLIAGGSLVLTARFWYQKAKELDLNIATYKHTAHILLQRLEIKDNAELDLPLFEDEDALLASLKTITAWVEALEKKNRSYAVALVKQNLDLEFTIEQRTKSLSEKTRQLELTNKIISEQQKILHETSKMTALGQMAGSVAHEINNPLSIIVGRLDQIRSLIEKHEWDAERLGQWLKACKKQCDRIAQIVKGMKIISHGDDQQPLETVNLIDIVRDVIAVCEDTLRKREIDVIEEFSAEAVILECAQTPISQVLLNLINNAADAMENHGEVRILILRASLEGGQVQLDIIDNGPGIPKHIQEKVFEPFYTSKDIGKGTGLGLSICLGIIKRHRGKLSLMPSAQGAHFRIQLPQKQDTMRAA
jgi:C4-dicarboxylate-specific signal transduction histidine kinase